MQRYFEAQPDSRRRSRDGVVSQMVEVAPRNSSDSRPRASFHRRKLVEGIFNSHGVADWYEQTLAEVFDHHARRDVRPAGRRRTRPDAAQLDPKRLAEVAAQKAIDSKNPRDLPPGKYTVILEPAAVLDAVGFMFWDFGGSALLEQRSFLNERIGTQLFGENITVWDDVVPSAADWRCRSMAKA